VVRSAASRIIVAAHFGAENIERGGVIEVFLVGGWVG
jgi:hypothetical protein